MAFYAACVGGFRLICSQITVSFWLWRPIVYLQATWSGLRHPGFGDGVIGKCCSSLPRSCLIDDYAKDGGNELFSKTHCAL